jgi:hypothetical protein
MKYYCFALALFSSAAFISSLVIGISKCLIPMESINAAAASLEEVTSLYCFSRAAAIVRDILWWSYNET